MKTRMHYIVKRICQLTVALFIIGGVSCKSESKGESSTSKAATTLPEMDIHTAVVAGNLEVVKQHISAGANLNEKEPFGGSSPLISACVFGKEEIAKTLIHAGADLNFQNNEGSTALITAAFFCRPEILKMLLAKGADKTIRNNYGATAYDSVLPSFDEAKPTYDMMGKMLEPMGLKLDDEYLRKTRPEIVNLLK